MEEIARRAGVGVGTLYRRFPDREALIRAVAQDNFALVLAESHAAAAEEASAWDALVRLLSRSRELRLSMQLALLSPLAWAIIRDDPETQRFRTSILGVLDNIVQAAQNEGTLRKDVGTGDIAVLLTLLLRRPPAAVDETAEMVAERVRTLLLDGLRARPGGSLPGRPITAEDVYPR
jgi:AcrR family transcriptional regulator